MFTHIEIETIGSCNRTCNTCLRQTTLDKDDPTHHGRFPVTAKVGDGMKMPMSTFKRIIDEAVEMGFEGDVCLQHFNEPLLDDRLVEFAQYVKTKPEIKGGVWACSNMDLITEERAKELDGVFDSFRVALYIPEEKQPAREAWLKSIFPNTRLDFTKGVHVVTHYSPFTNTADCVRDFKHEPCQSYNDYLILAYNGTVLHCCDDYTGHFGLGNVNTMSVKEIWESETHKRLVSDLSVAGGRLKYDYCSVCPRTDTFCSEATAYISTSV